MQLTIHSHNGVLDASAEFSLGHLTQMTSFSSTAFSHRKSDGITESIYAPTDVLPLIIQRNAERFYRALPPVSSGNRSLNPLTIGPEKVVDSLIEEFSGRYHEIDFSLSEFIAGWARQFGRAGYAAIARLCEEIRASRPLPLDLEHASLDDIFRHQIQSQISLSSMLQRFLEGDEERYFFETLGVAPDKSHDRHALFTALQSYLLSEPSEHDQEVLWIAIRSLRNGGIVSPDYSHIFVDFIDSVSDEDFLTGFRIIASSTLSEVLSREEKLIDDRVSHQWIRADQTHLHYDKLAHARSPRINERIRAIMGCLETSENPVNHLKGLTASEQEIVFVCLRNIWKKPGQKREILHAIGGEILEQGINAEIFLGPETMEYLLRLPEHHERAVGYCEKMLPLLSQADEEKYIEVLLSGVYQKSQEKNMVHTLFLPLFRKKRGAVSLTILAYIWDYCDDREVKHFVAKIDPVSFVELYWRVRNPDRKNTLTKVCRAQIGHIFHEVQKGHVAPYALFIHSITQPKRTHAFDALFGISNLFLIQNKNMPLLPGPQPLNVIERVKRQIMFLFATTTRQHEKIIQHSLGEAGKLRESLLYGFAEGYYPVGGKIHFSSPLAREKVALLHQVVGFGNTPFKLLHADTSLNLPPCQSPLELMAILYRLAHLGIITDRELQLQLSIAGRVPNVLAGVLGSMSLFAKPHKKEYKPEAFLTSHNEETATCICCYDSGVLDREGFPHIPPHAEGRTDMLGFSDILEVITYYIVGNLISQSYFGGKFQEIGKKFIDEYMGLLRQHSMIDILEKKWVHTPGTKRSPEEEEGHYKTVKRCTDILCDDIDRYMKLGNAHGISFEVKRLIYSYITRYSLLPLQEPWAQRYLQYLNYKTFTIQEEVSKKIS